MAAKKVKVRFLQTRTVQDEEGQVFEEGKEYDLSEDSAEHWLKRGVAEVATTKSKSTEATPVAPGDDK